MAVVSDASKLQSSPTHGDVGELPALVGDDCGDEDVCTGGCVLIRLVGG